MPLCSFLRIAIPEYHHCPRTALLSLNMAATPGVRLNSSVPLIWTMFLRTFVLSRNAPFLYHVTIKSVKSFYNDRSLHSAPDFLGAIIVENDKCITLAIDAMYRRSTDYLMVFS